MPDSRDFFRQFAPSRSAQYPDLISPDEDQGFKGTLTNLRVFDGIDGRVPILEYAQETPPFSWLAGAWHARQLLAEDPPEIGSYMHVRRLADRGRSHRYAITHGDGSEATEAKWVPDPDEPTGDTSGSDEYKPIGDVGDPVPPKPKARTKKSLADRAREESA